MAIAPDIAPENLFGDKYKILERHQTDYAERFLSPYFPKPLAGLVAWYVADAKIMDRAGWKEYFGVDIGLEPERITRALSFDSFYQFFHAQSPVDDKSQVCERCLTPVVVPESITRHGITVPYDLNRLESLANKPQKGFALAFYHKNFSRLPWGDAIVESGLLIQFQNVVGCNLGWNQQIRYLRNLKEHLRHIPVLQDWVERAQGAGDNLPAVSGAEDRSLFAFKAPDLCLEVTAFVIDYVVRGQYSRGIFGLTKNCAKLVHGRRDRVMVGFDFPFANSGSQRPPDLIITNNLDTESEQIGVVLQLLMKNLRI